MMSYPYLFINGHIVPQDKALIPVNDLGLLRGLGIFDYFRVWDGIPVFLEDHIQRLQNSMELVGLNVGYDATDWVEKIHALIKANAADRAGFRIVVTGGFSEDGYTMPEQKNIYMMLHHLPPNDAAQYEKGVSLITSDYRRDLPTAKTTIYVKSLQLQPQVKKEGAFEVLYHWQGEITECSRCNFFYIDQEGTILTPNTGLLKGITRKKVLEIAKENSLPLVERPIYLHEMAQMAGAFLTASTKGVLPVVRIDQQVIGNGQVHPLCKTLQEKFQERFEQYVASARLAQIVL